MSIENESIQMSTDVNCDGIENCHMHEGMRIIDKHGIEKVLSDLRAQGQRIWQGVSRMAKSTREKIKLVSSAGTGHYYTTAKNKRLHPDKMETKKYDPVVRKHVMYKEAKIK